MQTDDHRHNKSASRERIFRRSGGIGGTDDHAFREVMQCDGAGHDHTCNKKISAAFAVFLIMVEVDKLIQTVGGFGMAGVNVRDLVVCLLVNDMVEQENDGKADENSRDGEPKTGTLAFLNRFRDQIHADNAEHDTAGKAQEETYDPVGILAETGGKQTADPRAANTCDGRHRCHPEKHIHTSIPPNCVSVS